MTHRLPATAAQLKRALSSLHVYPEIDIVADGEGWTTIVAGVAASEFHKKRFQAECHRLQLDFKLVDDPSPCEAIRNSKGASTMADNKKKTGKADRSKVAASEGYEVNYFANKHSITREQAGS